METIEVVIYTFVAIVVGGMTLAFLAGWNYTNFYDKLVGKDDTTFEKVDNVTFVGKAIKFWENCGLGAVDDEATYYVEGTKPLTEAQVFKVVIKLNMCNTLQSASNGCGTREQLDFPAAIDLPHVVRLECDSANRRLVISG